MASTITLSAEDQEFLAKCEEDLKHRFTEQDEEFMKVFNAEPAVPPIVEHWWVSHNQGRRNDRRYNRRNHPYDRRDDRNRDDRSRDDRSRDDRSRDDRSRDDRDRRGYNDYNDHRDRRYNERYSGRSDRPKYC